MKKTACYLKFIMLVCIMCIGFVSCNSEEEENSNTNENQRLEGTTWRSEQYNTHQTERIYVNRVEENTYVKNQLKKVRGLKYTVDYNSESTDLSVNLCERSGHGHDLQMSLEFRAGKCNIIMKKSITEYKSVRTTTDKVLKFEEGSYWVDWGNYNMEGFTVDNNGVYRANGNLFIPLDGNFCIVEETKYEYTNLTTENKTLDESTIVADFILSKGALTFNYVENGQNKSFTGTIADDNTYIYIPNNPFYISFNYFR